MGCLALGMKYFTRIWIAVLFLVLSHAVPAQNYPAKPIRFIVPNGMGGSTDLVARSIAQKLSDVLGQQVVVDNRPGSGGIVGTEMVARSPADGYTLLMGTIGNLAISPNLYKKLTYDPLRDFAAVTQLAASAYVLVVHPAVPAQSVREFVALAKARPGTMNYASAGSGTGSHLTMELFRTVTGTE
jgi:tripartite-type tricarboxylate transporter receptor subunit TctC